MGFFDGIKNAATGYFRQAATNTAAQYGINIGGTSPQAQAPVPIQGVPNQAPQVLTPNAQVIVGEPFYKRPIVIIGVVAAIVAIVWLATRKR